MVDFRDHLLLFSSGSQDRICLGSSSGDQIRKAEALASRRPVGSIRLASSRKVLEIIFTPREGIIKVKRILSLIEISFLHISGD